MEFLLYSYDLKIVINILYDIVWSIFKLKVFKIYMLKRKYMYEFRIIDFRIRFVMKKELKIKKKRCYGSIFLYLSLSLGLIFSLIDFL